MTTPELTKWLRENSSGVYRPAAEAADLIEDLQKLSAALLEDLQHRVEDRADSSLPEWEAEAKRLGILANDEWWHRRDQSSIQLGTLSPVATHGLLSLGSYRVGFDARCGIKRG